MSTVSMNTASINLGPSIHYAQTGEIEIQGEAVVVYPWKVLLDQFVEAVNEPAWAQALLLGTSLLGILVAGLALAGVALLTH